MKILCIADEESKSLWDYYSEDKLEGIELIISCGDLKPDYLEFLVTMSNVPLLYIPGNHDGRFRDNPPGGCTCIDGIIYDFKGIHIMGLGGSMRYKDGPYQYSESQMNHRIWKLKAEMFKKGGIDIFVSHAPAKGYGDLSDLPHNGFMCFNTLMNCVHPQYMLHGHVHGSYVAGLSRTIEHESGTKIINCYDRYILDYPDELRHINRRKDFIKEFPGKFI